MAKNITIDELVAMTQRGLADVEQRIGVRMDTGFSALTTLMRTHRRERAISGNKVVDARSAPSS